MKINSDNQSEVEKSVLSVLIAPDDEDGYECDPVTSQKVVGPLVSLLAEVGDGDITADSIAEFAYTYMKWS